MPPIRFFLLFLFIGLEGLLSEPLERKKWRIVGGEIAKDGAHPYQVSIRYYEGKYPYCGGVIVAEKSVVTAAHCLIGFPLEEVVIIVGTNYLSHGGEEYAAFLFKIHPDYRPSPKTNNIGLIILKSSIIYNDRIKPIPLGREIIGENVQVTVTGWGFLSFPEEETTDELRVVELLTMTVANCKMALANRIPINEDQICTLTTAGKGVCMGDSGNPVVHNGVLVGIVSWQYPCATGLPDVFMRISSFAEWIDENKI